ncbi:hypothetical protein QJS10_CPB13g00572 [Acorus calamus]|uniref:Uncharacterized protein n=1 Tax=Acorus calamus TaxID=4465 RepID=A0AAV9DG55_ACOCL|nr:hypothetical protein QJS10_CPB13g00572 [Acorus calamus]
MNSPWTLKKQDSAVGLKDLCASRQYEWEGDYVLITRGRNEPLGRLGNAISPAIVYDVEKELRSESGDRFQQSKPHHLRRRKARRVTNARCIVAVRRSPRPPLERVLSLEEAREILPFKDVKLEAEFQSKMKKIMIAIVGGLGSSQI